MAHLLLRDRIHAAAGLFLPHALKAHNAVYQRKKGIIAANAAVIAGMNVCSALTIQNVPCQHELAVRAFRAQALGFAVAAIMGRTGALLVSEELKIHLKHLLASILLS